MIDDEDYLLCLGHSMTTDPNRKSIQLSINCQTIVLANHIKGPGQWDHKDRNFLNNQKNNLRLANKSQNGANRLKSKGIYSSRFKGVSWHKDKRIWVAYITKNNKRVHLGQFINEWEAASAYNKAALKLFGEFACLNEGNVVLLR